MNTCFQTANHYLLCITSNNRLLADYELILQQQTGLKVIYSGSLQSCLEAQEQAKAAAIIMIDAHLLCQKSAANHQLLNCSLLRSKPAILFDYNQESKIIDLYISSGIDDYLVHPIHPLALCMKIELLINSYRILSLTEDNNKKNRALLEAIQESELLKKETSLASHIFYNYLLGKNEPPLPQGLKRHLDFARDFSGDLILAQNTANNKSLVFHADATGHGLAATITLMPLTQIFRTMATKGCKLTSILQEMNSVLNQQIPEDRFVAATLVEVDWELNEVTVWNGGMPAVTLINSAGQIKNTFTSSNPALGILESDRLNLSFTKAEFAEGDCLAAFSDGLSEQFDSEFQVCVGKNQALDWVIATLDEQTTTPLIDKVCQFSGKALPDDDISYYTFQLQKQQEANDSYFLNIHESRLSPFEWSYQIYGELIFEQDIPATCYSLLINNIKEPSLFNRAYQTISVLHQGIIDYCLLNLTLDTEAISGRNITSFLRKRNYLLRNISDQMMLGIKIAMKNEPNSPKLSIHFAHNGRPLTEDFLKREQFHRVQKNCKDVQLLNSGYKIKCIL